MRKKNAWEITANKGESVHLGFKKALNPKEYNITEMTDVTEVE